MKKLLGIVVLGFLLSGNVYADQPRIWFKNENTIHIAHKMHFSEFHNDIKRVAENHCKTFNKFYFWVQDHNRKPEIVKYYRNKIKSEYKKATVIEIFCSKKLISYAPNDSFTPGNKIKYTNFKNTTTASNNNTTNNQTSTNDKIAQSKKICKELGFKINTEKFADCALKMMAMQFETGNKVSNNDGSTTQKIIVKQQDDYDIGDAFFDLQKIIDSNYRSNNSNSGSTSTQRCKIYERAWGADMVCQ